MCDNETGRDRQQTAPKRHSKTVRLMIVQNAASGLFLQGYLAKITTNFY